MLNSPAAFTEGNREVSVDLDWIYRCSLCVQYKTAYGIGTCKRQVVSKSKEVLMTAIDVLILVFALFVIIIGGTKLALSAVKEYSALLGISRGLVYSMAPISGVFIILAQIINIYEDVTGNVIEEGGVE